MLEKLIHGRKRKEAKQDPKRKNRKHKHHRQIYRITDDNEDSIPDLGIMYAWSGMDRPMVFIDIDQSAIVINLDYEWAKKLAGANEETMDVLICHAIIEAYPENKNISTEEFNKQYWELLNA